MTCREKLKIEYPEMVREGVCGGCCGCPSGCGYLPDDPELCDKLACGKCWDREIPVAVKVGPTIKDSGERTEFSTGAVRDMHEGKGRMDLLPWAAIMEVSKHCENGAKKYGEHNVDKGILTHSFMDSAFRHMAKHMDGWEDEPHLIAAAWNILWAIQMHIKKPEMVDTPWKDEKKGGEEA